ncbi:MAG: hypothetical protein SGJ15_07275 [Bacteroidota bacterium]|nr:hypothetical protein [Bacteroidota bacterium]
MELTVKFGTETKIIKTNAQGGYKIEVTWSTACPSGLTEKQIKEENAQMNPEYIYVIIIAFLINQLKQSLSGSHFTYLHTKTYLYEAKNPLHINCCRIYTTAFMLPNR